MFKLDFIEVEPGTRCNTRFPIAKAPDGSDLSIPLIIVNGIKEGPRLLVIAGEHPEEVEGFLAVTDVAKELDPKRLTGTFIGIPCVTVAGYLHHVSIDVSGLRENPIDMRNIMREYPGKPDGTMTQRTAHAIINKIMTNVDYAISFHAGGDRGTSINMSSFIAEESELGRKTVELTHFFPFEIVWRSPPWGKLASAALGKGVPVLVVETTGEGRYKEEDVKLCVIGIRNIMKHLGMIDGSPEGIPEKRRYIDSETYIYASVGGFLRAKVKTGDLASKGTLLGENLDIYGNVSEKFEAPFDCIVTGIRTKPVVWAGEPVFLISSFIPDPRKEIVPTRVEKHISPP